MEQYQENLLKVQEIVKHLLHPKKNAIIEGVRKNGKLIGIEIWQLIKEPQSVGSRFSKDLCNIGALKKEKKGSKVHFSVDEERLSELLEKIAEVAKFRK